jgi:NADH-quinone oxidoreductase subunit H
LSSNKKYALLGGFRVVAQLVSYEVPHVLSVAAPVMLAGSLSLIDIVNKQPVWYIIVLPASAVIVLLSGMAEVGRSPFDLLDAESEIIAGHHIEYSGMKFALFFLAEYIHAFAVSCVVTALFLGGWRGEYRRRDGSLAMVFYQGCFAFQYHGVGARDSATPAD